MIKEKKIQFRFILPLPTVFLKKKLKLMLPTTYMHVKNSKLKIFTLKLFNLFAVGGRHLHNQRHNGQREHF